MMLYLLLSIVILGVLGITLGYLQYQGLPVFETLRWIALWAIAVIPMLILLALYMLSFVVVLGFDPLTPLRLDFIPLDYMRMYFLTFTPFSLPGIIIGIYLVKTDGERFRATDARTGKTGIWEFPAQRFEDLTVIDYNGNEIGKDGLHNIPWYGGSGWESDMYDPDEHIAVTSYYAGYSPSEIRQFKKVIDDIRTEFLEGYDSVLETEATRERRAAEDAARTGNTLIKNHEYAMGADGELPDSPIQDYLDKTGEDDEHDPENALEVYESSDVGGDESEDHSSPDSASDGDSGTGDRPTGGAENGGDAE